MPDIDSFGEGNIFSANRFDAIGKKDFDSLKIRYLELTSLFEINKILNSTLELNTILDNVLLTPMGRLMVSKGMVLLIKQPTVLKVENVKGIPLHNIGQCYSVQNFPRNAVLLKKTGTKPDRFFQEMEQNKMEIIVPMTAGEKDLGLLVYGKKYNSESFSQEDVEFLESLANLAAIAVDKSLLFKELKSTNKKLDKKVQELDTLFEINRELSSSLDKSQITQILSFAIMGEFLINKCIVLIETEGIFRLEVAKGMAEQGDNIDLSVGKFPVKNFVRQEQNYILLKEELDDPEFGPVCKVLYENGIEHLIPMFSKDVIKGFIGIGKKITGERVVKEDLSFLQTLGNEAMISIENAQMVQEMLEKQRMEDELMIAREIQKNLLPNQLPEIEGFDIAGKNISSYQVGGDYYDCIKLNDHLFGIAIADVSGKSTPAAILMANLQASLRALANDKTDIVKTVEDINKIICRNTTVDKFITFFYCILNSKTRTLTYINAGHNPPYIVHKDGSLQMLKKGGLILGLLPDAKFEHETVQLESEDFLFLFTDGVTEAMNKNEEEYDELRLEKFLQNENRKNPENLLTSLQQNISDYVGDVPQSDDMTMVGVWVF